MKKFFLLTLITILICTISFAKIFRVGYVGPQITGVDYATAQPAHDAAVDGDTIQFYQGSYNINSYNKRLFLVGNGYLLSGTGSNNGLNVNTGATLLSIYPAALSTASNGTTLAGFYQAVVYLQANTTLTNITITRCNNGQFYCQNVNAKLTDCKITQCYALSSSGFYDTGNTAIFTNCRVENSILPNLDLYGGSYASSFLFSNCHFIGVKNFYLYNVIVQNSVIVINGDGATPNITNTIFNNNIFSGVSTGVAGSNNLFNVNVTGVGASVYAGFPTQGSYSDDGRYQLTASSVAKGAGIGGVDIGIYGGANPYRLSGIPATPSIYRLDAASPNATTNPYTINFSIRSNN